MLAIDNLSVAVVKNKAQIDIVRDVSVDVHDGEILGVVGESGAGKSMMMSAIIKLFAPGAGIVAGTIHFDGQRLDNLPEKGMRKLRGGTIASICQDPLTSLDPCMRVGLQLSETILRHTPLSKAQAAQRALDLMAEVGIADPAGCYKRYPHEISGGMRQRIIIALALAGEPRLILADEPTTALDAATQHQVLMLLRKLCTKNNQSMIIITHDFGVVSAIADRIAVMYGGQILEVGPRENIISAPRHPYTQALIRCIPKLASNVSRIPQINGAMPRPGSLGTGCGFASRCSLRQEQCNDMPALKDVGKEQRVACWYTEI